ncbi:MAG: GNAT family N-acetyltransferase [Candidatus Fluviicola riflensis]|nr:MAG: GNAT family N-acetyltransferase [Candidatus Fluviicola riflensis]OGS76845.1 MAG: GNAT family N-acetyltransferase [Candidatus Fluviicola riflensis]OGS81775.1 MAG: GNAT family N-acetyltransferase [Fluviicola sp. RIFCSPHIGHO2_01_FULL_43_53]OGS88574.1 MAG: GNAT family N-acetyltransferase [Fluviicola sp. RIFCSPHIGHO2_12_FULL_43_24]
MDFELRPWSLDDLPGLVKYANNKNIARFMTDGFPFPYTDENGRAFIAMATANKPANIFAIVVNGEAAGGIGIHPLSDIYRKNAELGYWLAEPFWGNKIITHAIVKMVAYTFETFEIDRIFAKPFGSNAASQHVLEKAGFILEGKFEKTIIKNGELEDELVYAIRRS